ncbi:hypothetical protein HK104_006424 [Borealophlyctis nickersoniae]|nr:hypothetical protein HK104_006424 [Borealophlyctis nickersoniae]
MADFKPHFKPERITDLVEYLEERRRVEIRRTRKAPYPWTHDPILQEYRFCSVLREDDAVSRVLADIFDGKKPETHPHFFFNVVFHRHVSKSEYNLDAGYITSLGDAEKKVQAWERLRKRTGNAWRTSSFQACCTATAFLRGLKPNWEKSKTMSKLFREGRRPPSQREIYDGLYQFANVRTFHAFQGACDAVMYGAVDLDPDFVMAGPGAKKGLRYLEGFDVRNWSRDYPSEGDNTAEALIRDLTVILNQKLKERRMVRNRKDELRKKELSNLRMVDVEHALCELQKYVRGTGLRLGRWGEGAGGTVRIIGEVELDTRSASVVEGLHSTPKRKLTSPVDYPSAKKRKISQADVQSHCPADPHRRYINDAHSQDGIFLHAGDVVAIFPDPAESDDAYWLAKVTRPVQFSQGSPPNRIGIRYYDRCSLPSKFRPRSAAERENIAETFKELKKDTSVGLCSMVEDEQKMMIAINWDEEDIVDGKYYLVDKKLDERLREMARLTARSNCF